jgi:hypothetical protein
MHAQSVHHFSMPLMADDVLDAHYMLACDASHPTSDLLAFLPAAGMVVLGCMMTATSSSLSAAGSCMQLCMLRSMLYMCWLDACHCAAAVCQCTHEL